MNRDVTETVYDSLEAINKRKAELAGQMADEEKVIRRRWDSLFHDKEPEALTPSQKLVRYMSVGASALDGAFLGWKLYRKFRK